ncbi:hypothetical protein GCM10023093_26440 [Nemorincola caseinilytica]|uniref:Dolichyl-phosphate-mannose--protein mannosyltransferase n=1 Tax=Nemorincola caseinilytica TaxID=2054315 RepID=A0ABP8NP49_9BACT
MAKKQQATPAPAPRQPEKPIAETPKEKAPEYKVSDPRFWFFGFKGQAIILSLLAFVIYCNTFRHEFAHDDGIVIVKNEFVLEGFAGLKGIMTEDAYQSYYRQLNTTNQLKGGRFRPLSILSFAVEQQFLGAVPVEGVDSVLKKQISYGVSGPDQKQLIHNMQVRHVFNVLWYMLSVVVLLYFLRYIVFSGYPLIAFVAALLFTAHPVHTEVVANVKSRDEIMSLLFMCLTFIFAFKYEDNKRKPWLLAVALFSYFLAFLSKEYAITVLALLPMALYVFRGYSVYRSLTAILPFFTMVFVYLVVRLRAISPELATNEAIAESSKTLISSYWLLAIVLGGGALYLFAKPANTDKSDTSVFWSKMMPFLPFLLLSAAVVSVLYSGLPPVIESAAQEVLNNPYLFAEGPQKLATEISSSLYYLKFLVFPHPLSADYSYAQIPYKDFSHWSVSLSILVHLGLLILMFVFLPKRSLAASQQKVTVGGKEILCFAIAFYMLHLLMINNLVFDIGATLGERLIYHSSVGFVIAAAWLLCKGAERLGSVSAANAAIASVLVVVVGLMSFKTIDRNKAWKNDSTLFGTDIKTVPNSVLVNANVAASYITLADFEKTPEGKEKYLKDAIKILDHTLGIHPRFVAAYLNRGIAWYKLGDIDKAVENMNSVKKLYPTYPTLPGMYKLICDHYLRVGWEQYGKLGRYAEAIEVYKKGLAVDPNNADLWYNMGGAYYTDHKAAEALAAFQRALQLSPGNQQAQAGINAATQMLHGIQPPTGHK